MEALADAEAQGQLGPVEREELRIYLGNHLRRCPMDAVESARYSIAELQLEGAKPKDAVSELNGVLAETPSDEVRNLTHLNLAEIYRLRLNDSAKAAEHYRQVGGPLRPRALQCMATMLEEKRDPDQAAKFLEQQIAEAKEKGEKVALLHRLAGLYKRSHRADLALATYQRITREFSADDIKQMREAAVREAEALFARLKAAHEQGRGDEAQQLPQQLQARAQELRFAGRWDEARAFMQAMQKGFQQLREQQERGPREGDEREPGPPRKQGKF
jgi:tetratricopeptide (TPR) repeat protein